MDSTGRERAHSLTVPLCPSASDSTMNKPARECYRLPYSAPGTPQSKRSGARHFGVEVSIHNNRLPKRLVAELQIETISTGCARGFLYSWYAVLILALAFQSVLALQWKMTNICGATEESLYHLDSWKSPCVQKYEHAPVLINWPDYAVNKQLYAVPRKLLDGSTRIRENQSEDDRGINSPRYLYNIRWVGSGHGTVLNVKLNRFVRVVLSMASPQENLPEGLNWKWYPLRVALEETPISPNNSDDSSFSSSFSFFSSFASSSSYWGSEGNSEGSSSSPLTTFLYNTSTLCLRSSPRCSSVVLPKNVAVAANGSRITLSIFGVEEELGNVSSSSAVGIVFQRASYTVGTIVCRYAFMLFSILHLIRFVYRKRYSKTLYEQYWMMILHLALYFYLDPVFAAGIYDNNGDRVYRFFEFRIPTYFAALASCFIFALIVISIDWSENDEMEDQQEVLIENTNGSPNSGSPPSYLLLGHNNNDCSIDSSPIRQKQKQKQEKQQERLVTEEEEVCYPAREVSRCGSFEASSGVRPIYATRGSIPFWAKMAMINYLVAILSLDIAQSYIRGWDWGAETSCTDFACLYIQYLIYGVMLLFMLTCCVLLVWLHRNLGKRPYLETRPQQLACRVFIFVFSTALIYFVVQVLLIALLYPQIVGVAAYQPLTQISPVIVSTFFVNHMTFVYTTTVASRRVPIRPDNPRWRHVVWSREWYRWLELHGGILYIFHNERQERNFMWLQNKKKISAIKSSKVKCENSKNESLLEKGKGSNVHTTECDGNSTTSTRVVTGEELRYPKNEYQDDDDNDREPFSEDYNSEVEEYYYDEASANVSNSADMGQTSHGAMRVKNEVLNFLQKAERHLIDRPATIIDLLEEALVDPLQSLLVRGSGHMPFFNLETAIDCLNLSWEAYVTVEDNLNEDFSSGDSSTSLRYIANILHSMVIYYAPCCSCLNYDDDDDDDDDNNDNDVDDSMNSTSVSAITTKNYNHNIGNSSKSEVTMEYTDTIPDMGEVQSPLSSSTIQRPSSSSLPLKPKPKMSTEQYGYNQVAVFQGRDVQVVITVMDTTLPCHRRKLPRLVIAFRGTDNISNAREDLRFRQRTWREVDSRRQWGIRQKAKVHTGFLNIWISLKEPVLRTLKAYMHAHPDVLFSVFCTGHSLGGALASLCAYSVRRMLRLIKYPLTEVTVYTFGQPPVGNKAFQIAYNKAIPRTFRVVNESDAVSLIGMYGCHVGIEVDIDRHGNYICKPMFIERLFRPTQGKGFAVTNHTLAAYAVSLNAVAVRNTGGACKVRCLEAYVQSTTSLKKSKLQLPPSTLS
ncbi:Fungal lipase-like domain [Trypanosoma melophagium]|uniref:Fungal lipase-like domain n=1 Tax=Trypanosoma melophagium TaxID=715481 RepID=UPI003519FC1D|nr:Fungal lipase-like domain [Trypanosoma melophagium]